MVPRGCQWAGRAVRNREVRDIEGDEKAAEYRQTAPRLHRLTPIPGTSPTPTHPSRPPAHPKQQVRMSLAARRRGQKVVRKGMIG